MALIWVEETASSAADAHAGTAGGERELLRIVVGGQRIGSEPAAENGQKLAGNDTAFHLIIGAVDDAGNGRRGGAGIHMQHPVGPRGDVKAAIRQ